MRQDIIRRRKYSDNIIGDTSSLQISSYPVAARYLAKRLSNKQGTACELCCGIGVSLIELSQEFGNVIGIDIDCQVLKACKSNLDNANVSNYELMCSDISSEDTLKNIEADVVLYDIPYWADNTKNTINKNPELKSVINNIRNYVTPNIVICVPPFMIYEEIFDQLGNCELLQIYIDDRHDRNLVFLGDLIKTPGENLLKLFK